MSSTDPKQDDGKFDPNKPLSDEELEIIEGLTPTENFDAVPAGKGKEELLAKAAVSNVPRNFYDLYGAARKSYDYSSIDRGAAFEYGASKIDIDLANALLGVEQQGPFEASYALNYACLISLIKQRDFANDHYATIIATLESSMGFVDVSVPDWPSMMPMVAQYQREQNGQTIEGRRVSKGDLLKELTRRMVPEKGRLEALVGLIVIHDRIWSRPEVQKSLKLHQQFDEQCVERLSRCWEMYSFPVLGLFIDSPFELSKERAIELEAMVEAHFDA